MATCTRRAAQFLPNQSAKAPWGTFAPPRRTGPGALVIGVPATCGVAGADVQNNLLVIKLGGDAVATPDQIAAAARRVALVAPSRPVVVVTSARRGMTDHLLQLCHDVDRAVSGGTSAELLLSAHRAVAAGELVTAVLVAAALERLGTRAVALDARQAGLSGGRNPGLARLERIRRTPIRAALAAGIVPVVTGFQVAVRRDIRILGRGGSDVTAVAIAAAFRAAACRFYKLHGLRLADPRLDPTAAPVGTIGFTELHSLLAAGARVLHPDAATAAERFGVRLEFEEFPGDGPVSVVTPNRLACPKPVAPVP